MRTLVIKTIVSFSDKQIESGTVAFANDHTNYIDVATLVKPPDLYTAKAGMLIGAGSIIVDGWSDRETNQMIKDGTLCPAEQKRHFNLDDVLPKTMFQFMGDKANNRIPMKDILASHGIYTIEQIAENASGIVPFTTGVDIAKKRGIKKTVKEILKDYLDDNQIEDMIERCKKIVAEK